MKRFFRIFIPVVVFLIANILFLSFANAGNWSSVSCGGSKTVAKMMDGTIWAWGYDVNGLLGVGVINYVNKTKPMQVGTASDWLSISCGDDHIVVIKTDGTLWAWGDNEYGQLGIGYSGSYYNRNSPTQVGTATNWRYISNGFNSSLAIKTDGTLWAWGYNLHYQLGFGDDTLRTAPTQVGVDTNWSSVSTSGGNTLAIKTDGTLWAWGISSGNVPTQIGTNTDWTFISNGSGSDFAIKTDGTLWAWGDNYCGQLGLGDSGYSTYRSTPIQVNISPTLSWNGETNYISDGINPDTAISTNIYTYKIKYIDPDGDTPLSGYPKIHIKKDNSEISSSPFSMDYVSGVSTTGIIYSYSTKLSTGTDYTYYFEAYDVFNASATGSPTISNNAPDVSMSSGDWLSISCGNAHSLAIKTDGTLWSWGYNNYGQLGVGDTANRTVPTQVGNETNWAYIACGAYHSIAIKTNGTLWSWGWNLYNQLGLGDTTDRITPTQVGNATNWSTVSCGYYHTSAINTDRTIWSWGNNNYGQLGLGDTTKRTIPTQIGSATNWSFINCGHYNTLAIKTDGTLWVWGNNGNGQVGDGTTTQRNTPVQIGSDTKWVSIAAGGYHSLALKADEIRRAWGNKRE